MAIRFVALKFIFIAQSSFFVVILQGLLDRFQRNFLFFFSRFLLNCYLPTLSFVKEASVPSFTFFFLWQETTTTRTKRGARKCREKCLFCSCNLESVRVPIYRQEEGTLWLCTHAKPYKRWKQRKEKKRVKKKKIKHHPAIGSIKIQQHNGCSIT